MAKAYKDPIVTQFAGVNPDSLQPKVSTNTVQE